jgi:uncharacterized protein YjbI with pentapeptide repeats
MGARKKASWAGAAERPAVAEDPAPLPTDLSTPVDLEDVHVADLDWTGTRAFSLSIERSRIERSRFTGASFEEVHLEDCELVDCELSGAALLRLRALRVVFRRCRMSGLAVMEGTLRDVHVDDCRVDEATLRIKDGRYVVFESCELAGTDLKEAVLVDARFEGCNLTRADLGDAHLSGVRVAGGSVDGLRGVRHLRGATVSQDLVIPLSHALFGESGIVVDSSDRDHDV